MSFLFRGEIQDEGGYVEGKLIYNNVIRETEQVFHMCKYSHDTTKDIKVRTETVQIKFGDKWLSYAELLELSKYMKEHNENIKEMNNYTYGKGENK